MAKVLIAPLGVGVIDKNSPKREYRQANYKFEGDKEPISSPFIISVLTKKLKVDKVIVVGTSKSMWEELYEYYAKEVDEFDEDYKIKIKEKIDKSNCKNHELSEEELKKVEEVIDKYLKKINPNATGGSKCKIIKYGINKDEIWENFDIFMGIIEEINNGDEIYLDITHSFRSIPLFMYIMLEFIKYFKNVKLKGIYYGMVDTVIGELGYAPVVDLSPIFEISEWIKGMYEFTTYGNGYLISKLLEKENKEISEKLQKISKYIDANYLKELREEIEELKSLLNGCPDNGRFLKYFISELHKFVNKFSDSKSDFEFLISMAKWNFDNKKYSSGYLCLTDSIFWRLCEFYNLPPIYKNREVMKGMIYCLKDSSYKNIKDIHQKLRDIRNKIAHADVSKKGSEFNPKEDLKMVTNLLRNIELPNFDEIIEELKSEIKNNPENSEKLIKLLKDILNIQIINKIIKAYNFENNEIYWNFISKYLLNRNNKCNSEKLKEIIDIFHKRINNIEELEESFNLLKNVKDEELLDGLALQNAVSHYAKFKLSKLYGIENRENADIFRWILLNRKLCSKNLILQEINKNYFKIYSNRFNQVSDDVLSASKNIIEELNKDLLKIVEEIPLNIIKIEYKRYYSNNW
ncbi:CRISPR-associated protein, TM1812 family [Methanocaldococcus bathoardescens]|uniref:CRISPR-associated protein, TM1812 family n=1 Tax=Methanocaldococcus bathoardescens TaxID=1301915 RepID=A0A076LIL3_9EURY|nr:TIGR02221 family CRISPR-associated protein [Methanocaldococcus bathoardescens]AIJ06333.1 CRISPR-associated protein, TM1812 family [Methanocaldococcus bathoardescens]